MKNRFFFFLLLLVSTCFLQAQEGWELVKDNKGIRVYTQSSEQDSFKTFKAQIAVQASIHSFVALLSDIDNFKDWGYKISEANLLKREGDTMQIYYSVAKAPFPYKNRDGIYLNRFIWDSHQKILTVNIEVLDDYLEHKKNLVRVQGQGSWTVKVKPNGKLEIVFQLQLNPGGNVAPWMANIFVDDSPYYTLLNLKEVIGNKKYQNQHFEFLN